MWEYPANCLHLLIVPRNGRKELSIALNFLNLLVWTGMALFVPNDHLLQVIFITSYNCIGCVYSASFKLCHFVIDSFNLVSLNLNTLKFKALLDFFEIKVVCHMHSGQCNMTSSELSS